MDHDLKRLLAYHSIENIASSSWAWARRSCFGTRPPDAGLAGVIAALYHTINHASFKALLFLGAARCSMPRTRATWRKWGGLAKRMRWTSIFFPRRGSSHFGAAPLNGFISEWLTYQSLLQGFGTTTSLIRLMFPLSGACWR